MKRIKVEIPGRSYNIVIGPGLLNSSPELLNSGKSYSKILFVVDENIIGLYEKTIDKLRKQWKQKPVVFVYPASEKNKTLNYVEKIYGTMQQNAFGRDSAVISIGGGITGDTSGFAAASYMRGVDCIQVPTTLLSAIDSSVGGKTGVNFSGVKNIIGAFHQPRLVIIDTDFIKTLPEDELLCGLGEASKNAFLIDRKFHDFFIKGSKDFLKRDDTALGKLIAESVKFKAGVVSADERESGLRKILNLGHTFAHAIETEQKHKLKHGQAVIAGLTCSLYLSEKLGVIDKARLKNFLQIPLMFSDSIKIKNWNADVLFDVMTKDKKNRAGKIKFVLVQDIGKILVDVEASRKEIDYALTSGLSHFSI